MLTNCNLFAYKYSCFFRAYFNGDFIGVDIEAARHKYFKTNHSRHLYDTDNDYYYRIYSYSSK